MSDTDYLQVRRHWVAPWQLKYGVFRIRDGWPDTQPLEVFDAESAARLHLDHLTNTKPEEEG